MGMIKKNILKKIGFLLICMGAGVVIGIVTKKANIIELPSSADLGFTKLELLLTLFSSIPVGLFLSILIHELGHLLFGVIAGMKAHSFVIGPFNYEFRNGEQKSRFQFTKFFPGGFALSIPSSQESSRKETIWFIIGGPFFSLLLAIAGIYLGIISSGTPSIFYTATGIISLTLGLTNLYPKQIGALRTDGDRLLINLRGGPKAEAMNAQFIMNAYIMNDGLPTDWPEDLINTLENAEENSPEWAAGVNFRYLQAIHSENWQSARSHLNKVLAGIDEKTDQEQISYKNEDAMLKALGENKYSEAAEVLREGKKSQFTQKHVEKIYQAIVRIADNEFEVAIKLLKEAKELSPKSSFKGMVPISDIKIKHLNRYLENMENQPPTI